MGVNFVDVNFLLLLVGRKTRVKSQQKYEIIQSKLDSNMVHVQIQCNIISDVEQALLWKIKSNQMNEYIFILFERTYICLLCSFFG